MNIWVDADACPKTIKELLFKVAERTCVTITFVANQYLFMPPLPNIRFILVDSGFDVADRRIVELCKVDDIVVTADIPLAAEIVKKGASALNPRGILYGPHNIGQILAMRDLMENLRGGLMEEGSSGPAPFTTKDKENFANQLDKLMVRKR